METVSAQVDTLTQMVFANRATTIALLVVLDYLTDVLLVDQMQYYRTESVLVAMVIPCLVMVIVLL